MNYRKQFKIDCPGTVGETDQSFDDSNYIDWLEKTLDNTLNRLSLIEKTEEFNVLSLFDGMSCGQITLKELNIPVSKYYASEIDKFAIGQTQLNFPNTIQLGDIENWREWNINWSTINLILAGSPCQGFSFAGKQLNFNDERSKLFFVFVDILNHCKKFNPDVKFLLENVIMKKEYQKVINDTLGLFPVRINSTLVSAQNRYRLYWTNIKIKMVGLFNEIHTDIPQPKDNSILLKDILQPESAIDEKYYLKKHKWGNLKNINQKAAALTVGGHGAGNHSDMDILKIGCVKFGRSEDGKKIRRETKDKDYTPFQAKEINNIDYDKMNTVTCATTKDNLLLVDFSHRNEGIRYYKDKAPTLKARDYKEPRCILKDYKLRRLTPLECARLQTVPDWYKWNCSDTQQYKMLGNGWTIEVIKHIFSLINSLLVTFQVYVLVLFFSKLKYT